MVCLNSAPHFVSSVCVFFRWGRLFNFLVMNTVLYMSHMEMSQVVMLHSIAIELSVNSSVGLSIIKMA